MTYRTVPGPSRTLLPELGKLPGHLVWRAHARVILLLAELPPDVDVHAYGVLLALADGEPRSQQSLADTISVSRTTLANVAASLARAGLVERVRNPVDRRSYALTRTAAGAAAAVRWEPHIDALDDAFDRPFSDTERDDLRDLLVAVIHADLAEDTPGQLTRSIGFLVSRLHFRMHREFLAALEPLGIEPRHFGSLVALTASGPVAQAELARMLGVSGASVVQMVDDLEQRGLVQRRRDERDRRTQLLDLRPEAADVLARARVVQGATIGGRLDPLSAAETQRLVALLARFISAV